MKCSRCQHENPSALKFCGECGARLATVCASCGATNAPEQKFCGECGSKLSPDTARAKLASPDSYTPKHLAEKILTSKATLEGELKPVTVLFCDIVDSTALAARIGAEAMHRNLDAFFALALKTVHRYEGTINQFLGDGFMALFGAPLAHEDHARRAVLAALDFQHDLESNVGPFSPGTKISARIGLNTGTVVVGKIGDDLRMDYTAIGDTVNVAARLQHAAETGKILLSGSTHRAVADYVDCRSLPAILVKGKSDPIPVFEPLRVRAATERQQRVRTSTLPFVGREDQLDVFRQSFANLVSGHGGVVVVIGEPGLGKSRLLAEAKEFTAEMPLQWFEGSALSYGRTLSYWPFLEIIRACAGITEADDEDQSWKKLEHEVTRLFPAPEVAEVLPYLGTMLALAVPEKYSERVKYLDGLAMGHQISRSSRRFFERIAQDKPSVLVFEDWHWADESSMVLLEHLLPLQASVPLLLCIATRPDPKGALGKLRSALERLEAPYHELTLPPLAAEPSTAIVGSLIGPGALSPQLGELLLQRTGGNPFFLEEFAKSLLEMRAIAWDGGARQWRMNAEVDHSALPSTIEGVLLARIDRLDEDLKRVLRTASVIGRVFYYRVLGALAESAIDLENRLTALQSIDLINEKRHFPELEYVFKHALIQQAAYDSMLTERRRALHLRVGQCLEQMFADRIDEFYSVIAYHYAKAEAWSKAQEYLFKAGDQAGSIAADAEALEHYRKAVAAYDQEFKGTPDPLQRARIDRKIGEALFRTGQHDLAHSHLERAARHLGCPYPTSPRAVRFALLRALLREGAVNLSRRLFFRREVRVPLDPNDTELIRIWEAMGWIDFFLDGERLFLDILLLKERAERDPRSAEFSTALAHIGLAFDISGVYRVAARYHQEAMRRAKEASNSLAIAHSYQFQAMHDYHIGAWGSALTNWKEAASVYWATGNLRGWGGAFSLYVHTLLSKGDASCLATVQEQVRIAAETQDQQLQGWARTGLGRAHLREGAFETAIVELERAATQLELVPDYRILAWILAEFAAVHLRRGHLESALDMIERSFKLIKDRRLTGYSITRPMTMRAEVYLFACERMSGTQRKVMLKAAESACNAAAKQGKTVRDDGASSSLRLCGTYAWLTGDRKKAQRLWNRSIEEAESLGARYALAETNLEMGRRLNSGAHLIRAEALFLETAARADVSLTRQLLGGPIS